MLEDPLILAEFVQLMREIGKLGLSKYGEGSIQGMMLRGDRTRSERLQTEHIQSHAATHFQQYIDGIKHDFFDTRKHQLAAVAFNAMMEYYLSEEE